MPSFGMGSPQGPAMWLPGAGQFFVEPHVQKAYTISGFTRDSAGAVLGGCTVEVYEAIPGSNATNPEPKGRMVGMTVSNATTGAYSVEVSSIPGMLFQCDAYLAGAPDRAGTTVNTLQGS